MCVWGVGVCVRLRVSVYTWDKNISIRLYHVFVGQRPLAESISGWPAKQPTILNSPRLASQSEGRVSPAGRVTPCYRCASFDDE